jgi:hypothetical protein
MTEPTRLTKEEIMALPISAIKDGWSLKDGGLYLFVQTQDNLQQTIVIQDDNSYLSKGKK